MEETHFLPSSRTCQLLPELPFWIISDPPPNLRTASKNECE